MCDHCGCRSFPAIAELTGEHEEILDLAWTVSEAVRAGQPAPVVELATLRRLLDSHVIKEETGLYPLLIGEGDLTNELLGQLEEEHREIGEVFDVGGFSRKEYFALAAHIETEESELFPCAMFAFDDERWEAMLSAHREAETTTAASDSP